LGAGGCGAAGRGSWGAGQEAGRPDLAKMFDKREVMIAVRDGVKLHTEIYTPRDAKEALPIVMMRTPYGISAGARATAGCCMKTRTCSRTDIFSCFRIFGAVRFRGKI